MSPGVITKENDEGLTATLALSNELLALRRYWLLSEGKMMVTSPLTETVAARATTGNTAIKAS